MTLLEKHVVRKHDGLAVVLREGQLLRLTQPEGPQVIDFNAFNLDDPWEHLGSSVTRRRETIHPTTGNTLWTRAPWGAPHARDRRGYRPAPAVAERGGHARHAQRAVLRREQGGALRHRLAGVPGDPRESGGAVRTQRQLCTRPVQHLHAHGDRREQPDVLGRAVRREGRRLHRHARADAVHRRGLSLPRPVERARRAGVWASRYTRRGRRRPERVRLSCSRT